LPAALAAAAFVVVEVASLAASNLAALLETTNRRRTGAAFSLAALTSLLLDWVRAAFLTAVALRFNINNQTKKPCAGSENK
jgi:hypothetical protein